MRVIGIDPGSRKTGWGIIADVSGVLSLVDCGLIHAAKDGEASFSERLAHIFRELAAKCKLYNVEAAAIEQVFTAQNAQSALKLGQARGAAVAACASCGLAIYDYEPTLVKKSLVGAGRAEKGQVAFMVRRLLNIRESDWALDTTDAIAVAICHLSFSRFNNLAARAAMKTANARG